ncbi:hypothetical protein BP6252_11652 [Coleophoma cylindrospora]|uniref:Uncharacterized protein n=1 Tax=Coleophoma cylindrospora TaxID=1849047 RepID=A0A3D8QKB0_9HELO|nr:hypothetical protein BP6252_11652 [Coleophoma cylindrospora]
MYNNKNLEIQYGFNWWMPLFGTGVNTTLMAIVYIGYIDLGKDSNPKRFTMHGSTEAQPTNHAPTLGQNMVHTNRESENNSEENHTSDDLPSMQRDEHSDSKANAPRIFDNPATDDAHDRDPVFEHHKVEHKSENIPSTQGDEHSDSKANAPRVFDNDAYDREPVPAHHKVEYKSDNIPSTQRD